MSGMLQNSPTSIFNSKIFSGGYTPGPPLKWKGGEGRRKRRGNGRIGKDCVMAVGEDAPAPDPLGCSPQMKIPGAANILVFLYLKTEGKLTVERHHTYCALGRTYTRPQLWAAWAN